MNNRKKVFLASNFSEFSHLRTEIQKKFNEINEIVEFVSLDDNCADSRGVLERSLEESANVDYFILLLGNEYGGIYSDDEKSITHKEFELAKENDLHILIYLKEEFYSEKNINFSGSRNFCDFKKDVMSNNSVRSFINTNESDLDIATRIKKTLTQVLLRNKDEKIIEYKESNLTKSDDIIGSQHTNRKLLVDSNKQGNSRRKFDLWEVKTPHIEYILLLHKNVSSPIIVLKIAIERIKHKDVPVLVLRADNITSKEFTDTIKENFTRGLSYTLNNYINEFCIGNSDFSNVSKSNQGYSENFFVDQPVHKESNGAYEVEKNAIEYFQGQLSCENNNNCHLILGNPGSGKTSFCVELARVINQGEAKVAVLLSFQNIKDALSDEGRTIKNLHDLYVLFQQHSTEKIYPALTKIQLEVSVFCGNLIIIVDGLDEISTFFGKRFQKDNFIKSIQTMNSQLKNSNILLSSRRNVFDQNIIDNIDIKHLIGFNRELSLTYFNKRFQKGGENSDQRIKDQWETLSKSAIKKFDKILKEFKPETKTLPPFIIDLLPIPCENSETEDLSLENTIEYPSNKELNDQIIYDFIHREIGKQTSPLKTTKEYLDILLYIASEHGNSVSETAIKEYCDTYYDVQAEGVLNLLAVSPLLIKCENNILRFKYEFLEKYFLYLHIIDCAFVVNKYLVRAMSTQEQDTYLKVLTYYKNDQNKLDFQNIITQLKKYYLDNQEDKQEAERVKKSISFAVKLYVDVVGNKECDADKSKNILEFFTESGSVKNLFIYGDLIPFNFSSSRLVNCEFEFKEFNRSIFDCSHFSYCIITILDNNKKLNIPDGVIDTTCTVNGKEGILGKLNSSEVLQSFFSANFYKGGGFVRSEEPYFSLDGLSKESSFFKKLIELKIVCWDKQGKAYQINREKDVQNWFVNKRLSNNLQKVIKSLEANIRKLSDD